MKAWTYRQECKGSSLHEKESVVLLKLAHWQGVHAQTVKDSVQCILSWDELRIRRKETWDNTQAVAVLSSQILIHRIRGFRATSARETRKSTNTRRIPQLISRTWFPSNFSFFGTRNSYTITSLFWEPVAQFLTFTCQPITKFLTAVLLLLLSCASSSCLQCGARLRSCCFADWVFIFLFFKYLFEEIIDVIFPSFSRSS